MIVGLIIGILGILLLIIMHELGHFFAAKRGGVEVEEFGIGFPPKAKVLTKKDGTEYTLNWLPLGGFVRLKGEHDSDKAKGSYGAASLPRKVLIMVAGVGMNLLAAWVLLTILAFTGMPQVIDGQYYVASDSKVNRNDVIAAVTEGSPAEEAGIKDYDVIRFITPADCLGYDCSYDINSPDDLKNATSELAGQKVYVNFDRSGEGETQAATVILNSKEVVENANSAFAECVAESEQLGGNSENCPPPKGYLGIIPSLYTQRRATWSAPVVGAVNTAQFSWATLNGVGSIIADLFRGNPSQAAEQTSGIVGVVYIFSASSELGIVFSLLILALVSISLAVMNVLPIPALDGGRLFVTLFFRALRIPLNKDVEEKIHSTGFVTLMLLFVLITYVDIDRIVG